MIDAFHDSFPLKKAELAVTERELAEATVTSDTVLVEVTSRAEEAATTKDKVRAHR